MTAKRSEKTAERRILEAAFTVFSRDGITGATTKEIANVADVNEVTLFRHFESKDKLFIAVIREVVRGQEEALNQFDFDRYDLRRDLPLLARAYTANLETHEAFIRTMMAPSQRKPELTAQVKQEIVEPLRAKFFNYLREGQRRGLIRSDIDVRPAADSFYSMILGGVLRRGSYNPGYSREAYLNMIVEIFLAGIEPH